MSTSLSQFQKEMLVVVMTRKDGRDMRTSNVVAGHSVPARDKNCPAVFPVPGNEQDSQTDLMKLIMK